jgi:uncharacterized membrane protein YagU involved in acid resistance
MFSRAALGDSQMTSVVYCQASYREVAVRQEVRDLIDGGIGGVIGTVAMSSLMMAARRAGLLGRQPPERLVEKGLDRFGISRNRETQDALSVVMHFGFGATMGALFGLVYRRLHVPIGPAPAGTVFGILVWAVSYKGWIPALGVLPPPERDRPGRQLTMIAAHLVYGWTLGRSLEGATSARRKITSAAAA